MRAPAPIFIGGLAVAVIGPTIIIYGTEEQKQKHIPKILAGEEMWCQGFSEPGSGSDLASAPDPRRQRRRRLRHQRPEDLDDAGAHVAVHAAARADRPRRPEAQGPLLLHRAHELPGRRQSRPLMNMAGTHEFNEVFFDNVRIPAQQPRRRGGPRLVPGRDHARHRALEHRLRRGPAAQRRGPDPVREGEQEQRRRPDQVRPRCCGSSWPSASSRPRSR